MLLRQGKVRALVPKPAQGFRVHTASGDVVDLGTEFALEVTEDHADVHVLDGEVEWHPRSRPLRRLVDGESLLAIAIKYGTTVDALQRLNSLRSDHIQVGNTLRVLPGRVSIHVDKSEYRIWLKVDQRVLFHFAVGLGESNSTPEGTFKIKEKLKDPSHRDRPSMAIYLYNILPGIGVRSFHNRDEHLIDHFSVLRVDCMAEENPVRRGVLQFFLFW